MTSSSPSTLIRKLAAPAPRAPQRHRSAGGHDANPGPGEPPGAPALVQRPAQRAAVFVERQGTLDIDAHCHADPSRLRLLPGAREALALLAHSGYPIVVLTHLSGLASGCVTRLQFAQFQRAFEHRLRDEAGVELLDFLVCPHAPGPQGETACLCRMPAPGMLLHAARRHGLNLAHSWLVGNTLDHVEAGRRAGCRTVLLDSGAETRWRLTPLRWPDLKCIEWDEVARAVLSERHRVLGVHGAPRTYQQAWR